MTTRQSFDRALEELQCKIVRMGGLVEKAIYESVQSLAKRDLELAQKVKDGDNEIDDMELEIEDECIKLIATQQPMARDLRYIGTGLRIITDLERMGDHANDIAKISLRLGTDPLIKPLIDIPKMAEIAQKMVKDILDAYIQRNVDQVKAICKTDDEVDKLYRQVFDELMQMMQANPTIVVQATHLLLVARYLERIADHATNIGEAIIYLETGERSDLNK